MKKLLSITALMLGTFLAFSTAPGKTSDRSFIRNSNPFEKSETVGKMKNTNVAGDASHGENISFTVPPISAAAPVNLLVVDLTVQDRVTVTATSGLSSGTVSGSSFDGFYLKDLLSNAGTVSVPVNPGYSGTPTFTAASVPTNNIPKMYRNVSDPGLNIYGYSSTSLTTFTTGQQAFTGTVTWTVNTAVYNAMLTAPAAGGDVYFVADSVGALGTATLIGKYSVVKPEPVNLLVVDLTVPDRVTLTATAGLSSGTVSGSSFDGFYLKDLFSNAGTLAVPVNPGYSGTPTFTAASVPTNNIPKMYRNSSDPGLNIYGYSSTSPTTFTTGQQAFTGTVTWTISTAVYNAMLTAPVAGGDVYFSADSVGSLGTATLIGKYSVVKPEPVNLLVVDLSVQDRVTVTATTGLSSGTATGSTLNGFYLKDLLSNAGTVTVPLSPGFSGTPTFTAASVPTNDNPRMFRNSGTDPGLNIWGYSATSPTTFTTGQQAFTGTVTWTVSTAVYNAMLTAPDAGGEVYFSADSVGSLGTATLIGKYSVVKTGLAVTDTKKGNISVYPNPFLDVLKISDAQNVKSVSVHDMSGRQVKTLIPSANLNLSQLKEGVYIVNLLMKDGTVQSFKVIKKQ